MSAFNRSRLPPGLRRTASRLRRGARRLLTPFDRLIHLNSPVLLPPAHLRIYYYGTSRVGAFVRACDGARIEVLTHGLRPEHRLLDIGSGIGNLAIGLIDYLCGGYEGLEIHPEAVSWCQRAITPKHPHFRFHRADVLSGAYNPAGLVPASGYTFPFPDQSFDFIFLASVFTHMLPEAVEQYVREVARLLAPDGVCVASYFLLNDETRAGIDAGKSFMSFGVQHSSGLCRLHDSMKPEAAVALEETFIRQIHARNALRIRDIRRGRWWSGVSHDQDVLAVVRQEAPISSRIAPIE
ncbi:MAG: class I SAM-dependent methyltransferase [Vicinamibacterales bacterium]